MKKVLLLAAAALIAAACTIKEEIAEADQTLHPTVRAMVAEQSADETKTYYDDSSSPYIKWRAGDEISVFASAVNERYAFSGNDGETPALFDHVSGRTGMQTYSTVYAVYPYAEGNSITDDGLQLVFPAEQSYAEGSFGPGAAPMVALTTAGEDLLFHFLPVCGYLKIKLWNADGAKVKSIKLTAEGAQISGNASVYYSCTVAPEVTMASDSGDSVTLDCGEGVSLGTSASAATVFWIALPPVTMANGFTLTVTDTEGGVFTKSTTKSRTITRNVINSMGAVECEFVKKYELDNPNYLTLKSDGHSIVGYQTFGSAATTFYYSRDLVDWYLLPEDGIEVNSGSPVYLCGDNVGGISTSAKDYVNFQISGDKVKWAGQISYLLRYDKEYSEIVASDLCEYCFYRLFHNCTLLYNENFWTGAPLYTDFHCDIPAHCFEYMYANTAMYASATYIECKKAGDYAFYGMFLDCKSLYIGANLNIEELGAYCCSSMFYDSSVQYVALPTASVFGDYSCQRMFEKCSNVSAKQTIPSATYGVGALSNCYAETSISEVDIEVKGTQYGSAAFMATFDGCSNLNYVDAHLIAGEPKPYDFMTWLINVSPTGTFVANPNAKWSIGYNGIPNGWIVEYYAADLSTQETANSYIVSGEGQYRFKTLKGNSSESVGSVASAEVLWESFGTDEAPSEGDLVSDVAYYDGKIYFTASDKKGNAVIAAKDASGNILWSWHIWLTDQPADQVYNNNAGTMMDRNLGAWSAEPGSVGALGLLYQWGRKDPFLGSSDIATSTEAASTLSWPAAVACDSSTGTMAYASANPTTFIVGETTSRDWIYSASSADDNDRWGSTKSLYDPCPAGYRVPDGGDSGIWSVGFGSSSNWTDENDWDASNYGMNFGSTSVKLSSDTVWYPAAGYRSPLDGLLYYTGNGGHYWASSRYEGANSDAFHFANTGYVNPASHYYRANGRSVRCIKEN